MKPFDLENNEKIKPGFQIPENYFEQFEAKMMEEIADRKETKVVSLYYKKQVWMSAIAAVFLIAIAIPVYFNMANESKLDATAIENYLVQQRIGITELSKHLTEEDLVALENNLSLNENNTEAIDDYLSESENLDYYINE